MAFWTRITFAEGGLGFLLCPSYEKTHALIAKTDNSPPEAARSRRRWGIFFAGWTVFTALAVCWLIRRAGDANATASWFVEGDAAANASLAERIGNWLKLVDLNFHGIYPWILLAPYVAWLGGRFVLERARWRVSLPAHLAGCALFVAASLALASYNDWGRQIVIAYSSVTKAVIDGKTNPPGNAVQAHEFVIATNTSWTRMSGSWGAVGSAGLTLPPHPDNGAVAGGAGLEPPAGPGLRQMFFWRQRVSQTMSILFYVFGYAGIAGLAHTVHFYRRSREREGREAALQAQLTKARLNALQAQLHPHFLFNALNAISTLLRRDPRAAQDALASFSELLRLALCQSTQPEVTLREDLEFLRRYVEIQQTRLGDRLHFEEVIAPDVLEALVPALFLQPLVENAIRHGIEPSANPGVVRVLVQPLGGRLLVTVEDNGAGLSNKENERGAGAGIGLQNLRSRLQSLYGDGQKIDFGPQPEGGVIVRVEIPLRQAEQVETASAAP
jgi:two-component sensor histidine kinase